MYTDRTYLLSFFNKVTGPVDNTLHELAPPIKKKKLKDKKNKIKNTCDM